MEDCSCGKPYLLWRRFLCNTPWWLVVQLRAVLVGSSVEVRIGLLCRDDEHPQVMVGCLAATAASMANRMMGFWVDVLKDLFGWWVQEEQVWLGYICRGIDDFEVGWIIGRLVPFENCGETPCEARSLIKAAVSMEKSRKSTLLLIVRQVCHDCLMNEVVIVVVVFWMRSDKIFSCTQQSSSMVAPCTKRTIVIEVCEWWLTAPEEWQWLMVVYGGSQHQVSGDSDEVRVWWLPAPKDW